MEPEYSFLIVHAAGGEECFVCLDRVGRGAPIVSIRRPGIRPGAWRRTIYLCPGCHGGIANAQPLPYPFGPAGTGMTGVG